MSIIDDLLVTLGADAPVREVRIGAFWTAVVLESARFRESAILTRCGLASVLRGDDHHHHGQNPVRGAGHLHEHSARVLAELARSDSLLEASIGLAAINALLDVDEDACVELNAEQVILEQGTGKSVVVVGHFPFIPRVREAARQLWVLEKRPGQGAWGATPSPPPQTHPPASREEEVVALKQTAGDLRWQLAEIMERLDKLEKEEG